MLQIEEEQDHEAGHEALVSPTPSEPYYPLFRFRGSKVGQTFMHRGLYRTCSEATEFKQAKSTLNKTVQRSPPQRVSFKPVRPQTAYTFYGKGRV